MREDHLAQLVLDVVALCDKPHQIQTFLETRGVRLSAPWIQRRLIVYQDILLFLAERDPLTQDELTESTGDDDLRPEFIFCTNGKDRVWSCGLPVAEAKIVPAYLHPGNNVYGAEVLDLAYRKAIGEDVHATWGLDRLLHPYQKYGSIMIDHRPRQNATCIMAADSYFKPIKHVDGGDVIPLEGARLSTIKSCLDGRYDLGDYMVIVIQAAVNVAQLPESLVKNVEIAMMFEYIREIRVAYPGTIVVWSLGIPLPHIPAIARFNADCRAEFNRQSDPGFFLLDWRVNPFVRNGRQIMEYFREEDPFHLNELGVQLIWRKVVELVPFLRLVDIRMGSIDYQHDFRPGDKGNGQRRRDKFQG
jgi:hypothetical protein